MEGLSHSYNRVLEACAEKLEEMFGINQFQFLRYFELFPYDTLLENEPLKNPEEWYYLRDTRRHNALFFNFKTKGIKLRNKKYDWNDEYIKELKKTEEQVMKEQEHYEKKMEEVINSKVYQRLKSMIKWYFSCPSISLIRNILPVPNDFVLMVLQGKKKRLKLVEDENLNKIRDDLMDAYFYEKSKEEENE